MPIQPIHFTNIKVVQEGAASGTGVVEISPEILARLGWVDNDRIEVDLLPGDTQVLVQKLP